MLKLANSFYRYLWLTCENIYSKTSNVRKCAHIASCRRQTSKSGSFIKSLPLLSPLVPTEHQVRQLASNKKKLRLTRPLNSNVPKKYKQMGDSLQPTLNHVSCGGRFEITSTGEDSPSTEQWRRKSSEEASSERPPRPCQVPLDFRTWEPVGKRTDNTDGSGSTVKFKVVSYNVLAQYLLECHPYLYKDCHPYNLKWGVRSARLYDEIVNLNPDILCLQEVQASHLSSFYDQFNQSGYFGLFKQKTGHRHDGCAIYFKKSLFKLADHVSVEFYQPELPILNRDNIGIMVKLVPKAAPSSPFVVATTHLLYNPKRTDVRLAQIQVFLAEIDRFAYYNNGRESGHLPIILTGDFNSTIDSAVVKLLDKGEVSVEPFRDTSDWKRIGVTDNCQHLAVYLSRQAGHPQTDYRDIKIFNSEYSKVSTENGVEPEPPGMEYNELFNSGVVGHSLKLTSVYDKYKSDGQYEATTFQDYWVTVDYIYFSRYSNLHLVERLRLPTASDCEVLGCLPNDVYASDHLALGAFFELKTTKCSL